MNGAGILDLMGVRTQLTRATVFPGIAITEFSGEVTSNVETGIDESEGNELPSEFVATTVKIYC
jgi:hypothetical protein